ncbi:unnamed protein product [Pelagomonas calceolata]|uniref:Bromo domain-containing protein n=2 Tax=Pelagomonas calceolata TaxID=35677 RepID=A0A7S3ZY64_9STRA|nr:unnamed protein product [Pelagomonas calceolata]|mmetsp:Transcript_5/g.16  ORF Transcript_5/g.16 Transcript_5/m.16 type:complete len:1462 (+) Transcript_5:303-4688(+)
MATAGGAWRQAASNLLDVLKEMDIGQIFAKPVNQQIYRDYSQYVSQPMDLGLVRQKLPSYRNAKQFATDVRLVFSNALAYCGRVDATPDFKAVATLAKKMQRRFDKDAPLRPYLAPTPLRNRTPPPVDENLAAQIAANDGKVAMPRDVETCVSRVHQSLKRVKAAQSFRTPIETERWTDYEPKVGGQALDLTSVEHSFKRGAFQQDCGAWVLRMRRISANCLRYNTDTRFPELRQDAKFYLKALEKELAQKVRPVLQSVGCPTQAIDAAVPKLLRNWPQILEALETSILAHYDDLPPKAQISYYFLHPFGAYFPSPDQKEFVDDYARHVSEPICVGDVVSRLIEGTYDSLEPLKKDVSKVFANAMQYYGPDGAGRRLHEPSDCDDYVQRARRFDEAWTSVAKTLKNPGREVKSPTPKKDVNNAALRCLDKLRDHRESDGRGGSYQVATPFLHANMLPTHSEYLPCIGGRKNCRDFDSIESRGKRQGYSSLEAFANDVRRCFQNAHAWRTRCDDLVRVGSMDANTLAIAAEITNSADILLIVLDAALRQERSDFKPIAPAKRDASPARLTTPKKIKGQPSPTSPKPFWRLQAERLWSKVTKHEWVRNDGLQSYGGKLQWFRPTVEAFPTLREHYLGTIAKPMDLGLINHKLMNDEYEGREPFVEDLRLVFSNAVQFNRPAAQQAQSQQELNPHFVMDDLAAKTYAIATHLLNYVDHLELEYFKDDIADPPATPATAASITRNGISRDRYTCVLDEDEEARAKRREEAEAEAARLSALERAKLSESELRAAMDENKPAPAPAPPAITAGDAAVMAAFGELAPPAPAPAPAPAAPVEESKDQDGDATMSDAPPVRSDVARLASAALNQDAPPPPPAEDGEEPALKRVSTGELEEEAAAGKAPEPSDEMATRLAKLAAGVDEAAERRAAKRLECRRVRDRAVWPTRVRDSDADRECRTVLKQLRKLAVKKHSFYFEKMVRGVPDYAAFVARPTCLERVEQRLKIGVGEIARAFEDDGQEPLKPYASAREFGQELRLVLANARAYNERFRRNPHNVGYNICLAVDAVQPVLEEALFQFAFEAYERVGRMRLENSWEKKVAEEINEEVAAKRVVREQYEGIAREKAEAAVAHRKWEDRGQRNKLLRMLNERQRANLDILESNEAPRPASPTRQDVSEADVTPAKIAPVSRISAAVRAEDRRKAEKVRASAVFSALGDGAWASQTQEVEMAVEEEVVVKAEEAPVSFKGSVKFEIKSQRAAPARPALDAFSQIEDRVEEAPVRAPVARPKPVVPQKPAEPPVIECAGGDSGWVAVADQIEARVLLATTSQFVRCTVVLRGGSSEVRRSLVTWSLVEPGGVDDLTAGFYRDSLLRDARHKLRARSAAGSDAIRAARPSLREYSAVDAELLELDLRDACEGRVLATPVEDTIRGSNACSEGTLVFAAGALALRVAGRRVVCGGLLASSGG